MCCYKDEKPHYGTDLLELAKGLSLRIQVESRVQNADLSYSLFNPLRINQSYAERSNANPIPSAGV